MVTEISIKWEDQNKWWQDADGDGGSQGAWGSAGVEHWVQVSTQAGTPNPWTYTFPNAQWTHSSSYTIRLQATDQPGNATSVIGPVGFTFDTGISTTGVISPSAGGYFSASYPQVVGTAADAVSGIRSVEIAISSSASGTAGTWWNGSTYTASAEVWVGPRATISA